MRIAIDARAAAEERGGRGRLVRELLRTLAEQPHDHRYVLLAREPWDGAAFDNRFRWSLHDLPDPAWHLRAALVANRSCDVVLSTNSYLTAWFLTVPSVVLVYDLITFRPELLPQRRARWIELATMPLAVRRAHTLLCISQATADDLVARFPRAREKAAVALLGVDDRFAAAQDGPDTAEVLARHGIERPYVLAVGTLEPRKNLTRLIEAFAGLPAALRDRHELVLVGATGWDAEDILSALDARRDVVRRLGHVADEDLPALYRGAALFAYPSIYEGFGLPVAEAMACGTPVLTSSVSSLPEVAGDAALYVDPHDVGSIRAALARGLDDRAHASELARQGRERAARFTWTAFAEQTLEALRTAAGGRR